MGGTVVWTERMLTALEEGVKGGKWFSLIDKVYALPKLRAAFERVEANAGRREWTMTIAMYEADSTRTRDVSAPLRDGTYRPQPIRRDWIPKAARAAAAGDPDGAGPGGADSVALYWSRSSTGLRRAQLRVSSGAQRQRRPAAGRALLKRDITGSWMRT